MIGDAMNGFIVLLAVYLECLQYLEFADVPKLDCRVMAAREELISIGEHSQPHHRIVVSNETMGHSVAVEDTNRPIFMGRDEKVGVADDSKINSNSLVGGNLPVCIVFQDS